ncbi:hypothetical protein MASR1M65_07920 [Saprospiraceae bacterium]
MVLGVDKVSLVTVAQPPPRTSTWPPVKPDSMLPVWQRFVCKIAGLAHFVFHECAVDFVVGVIICVFGAGIEAQYN